VSGEVATLTVKTVPGEVDWSEPNHRIHRAVDYRARILQGNCDFFLDQAESIPQPEANQ